MNRADKDAPSGLDTESFQPVLQLPCALVIVGYTSYAPRLLDVFSQQPCKFHCECLRLAASRPGKDDAVSAGLVGSPLPRILAQLIRGLKIELVRHGPPQTQSRPLCNQVVQYP